MSNVALIVRSIALLVIGNVLFAPLSLRGVFTFMNPDSFVHAHAAFSLLLLLGIGVMNDLLGPDARWWKRVILAVPIACVAFVGGTFTAAVPLLRMADSFPVVEAARFLWTGFLVSAPTALILAVIVGTLMRWPARPSAIAHDGNDSSGPTAFL